MDNGLAPPVKRTAQLWIFLKSLRGGVEGSVCEVPRVARQKFLISTCCQDSPRIGSVVRRVCGDFDTVSVAGYRLKVSFIGVRELQGKC